MNNKPNTFKEIPVGHCFIDMPTPGDNAGHGGYRVTYTLFQKISAKKAKSLRTGTISNFLNKHTVIQVALNPFELEYLPS